MGKMGGSAAADIDAPIERCWEIVADLASAADWQEGLTSVEVVEVGDDGKAIVVDSVNDAKLRKLASRLRVGYEEPTRVWWHQERGDLKRVDGSWTLEDLGGDRTRATYRLEIDPGRAIGMLVRGAAEQKLHGMLVEGRPAELKRRAEAA